MRSSLTFAVTVAADTSNKDYFKLTAHPRVTSNSKLAVLGQCPRSYELLVLEASNKALAASIDFEDLDLPESSTAVNVDFAFGHAVGAGIQTFAATGDKEAALLAAYLSWRAPWDMVKLDKRGVYKNKSLSEALTAVELFPQFLATSLEDWEVYTMPNGKPATELSFCVDTADGFFHVGHVDTILQHKETKRLAVWEGKTSGRTQAETYGNSNQALGYCVILDTLSKRHNLPPSDYEVFYIVYDTAERQYQLIPFVKTRKQRAEWLQTILFSHSEIKRNDSFGFYPKRGDSCVDKYNKVCRWYGTCTINNSSIFPGLTSASDSATLDAFTFDLSLHISELIATQKELGSS